MGRHGKGSGVAGLSVPGRRLKADMPGRMRRSTAALVLALATALAAAGPAAGQAPPSKERPALLQADEVVYDEQQGIVTARGNVEVSQDERILLADSLSYNLQTDVITAQGEVALLEPDGKVFFADYVQLTGDLREGAIRAIRVLLTDRSRLAAASGERTGGNRTEFRRGVFSPCELCKEDPTRPPLWQIKAVEVIHDEEAQVIQYRDAWLEMFGLPVLYTPFFQHPDPTVDRQSGFLAPSFRVAEETLGFSTQIPYFWAISDSDDATFAPIFSTERNPVFAGQYRRRFARGSIELNGSGTVQDREVTGNRIENDVVRGHVDSFGRFDIDDTWRWGFDVNRASDDTYLRLYDFPKATERTLTSRVFTEGFRGRNYMAVNAYSFQGLRRDDNAQQPIVLPEIDYSFQSEPGFASGTYFVDANSLILTRLEGRDSRRLSLAAGWTLPYVTPGGLVTSLTASARGDAYWVNDVDPDSDAVDPDPDQAINDELTGRIFPQLSLRASYPLAGELARWRQVLEPEAQVVLAPESGNPDEIPNEDSIDFEFDDTNLFRPNRFTGLDRVDTGQRLDYGLTYSLYGADGGFANAFIGQSYRLSGGGEFARGSGVRDGLSDIVGRLDLRPWSGVRAVYRFRLDDEDLGSERQELDLRLGPRAFNVSLDYSFFNGTEDRFGDREELVAGVRTQLSQYWSLRARQRRDLQTGQALTTEVGLTYQDECFLISLTAARDEFRDREIEPEDSVFVRLIFKHLGELEKIGF